jgi:ribonucleoside-diphosphate reductase beta chain
MGEWGEVWGSFDKRKKKVANDSDVVVDEGADMFEAAGVAAE